MKISFVIPAFNSQTWLPHAIRSCLEQTYSDIEVIVVDDGSTDRTREILNHYEKKDPRFKAVRFVKNEGRSVARNEGNKAAQGDILAVLDADDISTPNRAEIVYRKFKNSDIDFLYGGATVIDVLGRPLNRVNPDIFDKEKALKEPFQNGIMHSTCAYTRAFGEKYKYRDSNISKLGIDDWDQQIRGKLGGAKFDYVPQLLACHRILNSQITKQRDEKAVLEEKRKHLSGVLTPA